VFLFQRVSDLSISIIHFKVEDTVKNIKGDIETLVPKYKDVIEIIQKDLVEPVVSGTNKEATTQTTQPVPRTRDTRESSRSEEQDEYDDPLRIGQPRRGIGVGFDPDWYAYFIVNGSSSGSNIGIRQRWCPTSPVAN
jgi:proteasome inhibitor subunit 1 (PI31)